MQGPKECNICQGPIDKVFYDTATRQGAWANLCPVCNRVYGISFGNDARLGTGIGQKYEKQADGTFKKVAG